MKSWTLRFRQSDKELFELVRSGTKSIETRAATVKYKNVAKGDTLIFVCGKERFEKVIAKTYHWPSVDAMVSEISFRDVMPLATSIDDMKKTYASYPGYEKKIRENGLLGFVLK